MARIGKASIPWMNKCTETFWNLTRGQLCKDNMIALRDYLLGKYTDPYAQRKYSTARRLFSSTFQRVDLTHDTQPFDPTKFRDREIWCVCKGIV